MERSKQRGSAGDRKASRVPYVYARRWSHSGFIARNKIPISWKSPSTTSTTSLGQLHDRLEALPRYTFEKVPVSVCALPNLSNISEGSEKSYAHSLVSSTRTATKTLQLGRTGEQSFAKIIQKFKPITVEAAENKIKIQSIAAEEKSSIEKKANRNKNDKNRYLSPVDDTHSTSLLLVASLGSDESIINDSIERVPEGIDCAPDNIVELLAQEAFQHNIKKNEIDRLQDIGINTGNRKTQESNSEAIENSPDFEVLKNVTFRKVYTNKNKKTSTSDESNTEVINQIPVNFVSSRKKPVRRKSSDDSINYLDEEDEEFQVVQDFVSQHCTQNSDEQISTTLDIDILECVSNVIDIVCREIEALKTPLVDLTNKDFFNIAMSPKKEKTKVKKENQKEAAKGKIEKNMGKCTKTKPHSQILKKNKAVTPNSKKNKLREKNSKNTPVIELKIDNKKTINAVDTRISNPVIEEDTDKLNDRSEKKVTPPGRRRRKLFSPKADEIEKPSLHIPETEDDDTVFSQIKTNIDHPKQKSKATCYKDIEKDRKKRIRQVRERRSKQYSPISPKTQKMNDLFEKVREKDNNQESILIVDKNSGRDIAIYNFSGGSEDEDFKQKKIEVGKRISTTTIGSIESSLSTRRGRVVSRVNYSEPKTDSSSDANKGKPVKKRQFKATRIIAIKKEKQISNEMIDQTMRKAVPLAALDTSSVQEEPKQTVVDILKPNIQQIPEMEMIQDNVIDQEVQLVFEKDKKKVQKKKKINKSALTKKGKGKIVLEVADLDGDKTDSPLPGLVIETMQVVKHHANDSISANMLHQLQKIIQDDAETGMVQLNNTQVLILEENNTSINTTRQLENDMNALIVADDSNQNKTKNKAIKNLENKNEVNEIELDRSISTMGNSPITAHGDFDEEPPTTKNLKEKMKPRHLELEDLNESDAAYYVRLENQISEPLEEANRESIDISHLQTTIQLFDNLHDTTEENKIVDIIKSTTSEKDDKKFFSDDTARWIPAQNNVFDSDASSCKASEGARHKINKESVKNKEAPKTCKELQIVMQRLSADEITKWVTPANSVHSEKCEMVTKTKPKAKNVFSKSVTDRRRNDNNAEAVELISVSGSQISKRSLTISFKNTKARSTNKKSLQDISHSKKLDGRNSATETSSKTIRKRKSSPEVERGSSKRAHEAESASFCESGPSMSSVHEWFKKYADNTEDEDLHLSLRDNIQNVLEKLDTTVAEIHQSTSKKFVSMFVNAQKDLNQADEERHKLFTDFAKRSKHIDKKFMEELKRQACNAISEDSKQKRAMVYLLKEDLHSIIDRLNSQRIKSSKSKI